ncbi:SRPBCC family protein [Lysinibacillus fusiformis]|uniref:SRPBCC family protein n=1 Tax=Lysinibacillus fusiformis TaxID=28031 RepID=UPI00215A4DD4|nr:SRPBCC family protein [Lysinibacillus fusiformis]MCR8853714.1 SRPBCC family protein [Lysinibacillus fusiformis]WKT76321.1 SRPBCC family protein [Lysinibacillus fusiformis]WKT79888.1 SRPBCC family protein [Lysinibacillus fusiformis]
MLNTNVTTKLKIKQPAHKVFEAIISPTEIGHYWFSSSSERWAEGKRIILRYEEYSAEGITSVLEIETNKKIVFSWGEEHGEVTVVTMTLEEYQGETIIEVVESGLNAHDPEIVTKMMGQKEGWIYTLTCLKGYLENGINTLRASLIH